MTTSVVRVYRSDVGPVTALRAAPAPSGDVYVAETTSGNLLHVARVTAAGAVTWQRELDLGSLYVDASGDPTALRISSSAAGVAVATLTDTFTPAGHAFLFSPTGTLLWQRELNLISELGPVALTSDGALFLSAIRNYADETSLVKLNASTGAVDWHVCLNDTTYAPAAMIAACAAVLSGNDLVLSLLGAVHSGSASRTHVQRIAAADGAVVWTRSVAWPSDTNSGALAVDPSDNIYVAGPSFLSTYGDLLPVAKLDSSGTQLWVADVDHSVATDAMNVVFGHYSAPGAASASGAQFLINTTGVLGVISFGHVVVPTTGTGAASVVLFSAEMAGANFSAGTGGALATNLTLGLVDDVSGTPRAVVVRDDGLSGDDNAFGDYVRETTAFVTATGTASVGTSSWTRGSTSTVSTSTSALTESAASVILAESYAPTTPSTTVNATAVAPATAFGLPVVLGLASSVAPATVFGTTRHMRIQEATGLAASTALGDPDVLLQYPATGLAAATALGTPATNFNLSYAATSVDEALVEFGELWVAVGLPPQARIASALAPVTAFGTPAAATAIQATATGSLDTALGEPTLRLLLSTAGITGTVLGTPTLRTPCQAAGFSATLFGLPQVGQAGICVGLAPRTAFGVPQALAPNPSAATGVTATAFGTPTFLCVLRARSGVMRTAFGAARCERTVP